MLTRSESGGDFVPKKESPFYISIILSDSTVQSLLWKSVDKSAEVISQSLLKTYKNQETLILSTDETLQDLGAESEEISAVIFGVPEDWVTKNDIKPDKKPLLKKITTELQLQPQGFVVLEEALTFYFKNQEPQFSALLAGIDSNQLLLRLFKYGTLMSNQVVGRSDMIVSDLKEGLARLQHLDQIRSLPTKFYLYSIVLEPEELIELQQKMVSHDWTSDDTFFYQPIFEVVTREMLATAIAVQAHFSLSNDNLITPPPVAVTASGSEPEIAFTTAPVVRAHSITSQQSTISAEQPTAKSFGIPISLTMPPQTTDSEDMLDEIRAAASNSEPNAKRSKFKSFFHKHAVALVGGFIAGVLALVLLAFIASRSVSQAEIQVKLKTELIAQSVEFTLDPSLTASNPEKLLLAAQVVTKEATGQKTAATTGVKLAGDKAKGKIQVINKTTSEKTFDAGIVVRVGTVSFTLDNQVKVASASVSESSDGETKKYGKTDAAVTASEIGTASNIAKDAEFVISSFDSGTYSGSAAEAFSGGSSREVRVVSQKDQDNLKNELLKDLTAQTQTTFTQDAAADMRVIPTGEARITSTEFDNKVGDEANNLNLKLTVTFQALAYGISDLRPLAQVVLLDQIPQGYELSAAEPSILSQPPQQASGSGKIQIQADISAQAQPQVNYEVWKQELAGKRIRDAQRILEQKSELTQVKIRLVPAILGRVFPWLPTQLDRIIFTPGE